MLRALLFLMFIAAIMVLPAHAQDTFPQPPTPLRAEDVFSEAADVIDTLPLWWMDDAALHLYDDSSGVWNHYALPAVPDDYASVSPNGDGTYRVSLCYPYSPFMQYYGANPDCLWQFDPAAGEFTQAALGFCGSVEAGEGWTLYVNPADNESYFCNLATGELSAPLPVDLGVLSTTGTSLGTFSVPVSEGGVNTAGNLIIIELYGSLQVFNMETGVSTPIGPMDGTISYFGGVQWVDDTRALMVTVLEATAPRQYNIYLFDINQPDSTVLLFSGEALSQPNNHDNPAAYEWLGSNCNFYELALDTLAISSYAIPGVCERGVPLNDGSGDWIVVQNHRVLRYNHETRAVQMLFMDGIGCYDALPAPGGLYQVLYFGEDCNELALMDTRSGEIDYVTDYAYGDARERWIDADTLLIYETPDNTDRLVHMATGEEIFLPRVLSQPGGVTSPFSDDGRWLLVEPEAGSIAVYDVLHNTTVEVAHNLMDYHVTVTWYEDNTLRVEAVSAEQIPVGRWRVSISGE
ncbi:MAG: hypothetical protein U0694_26650 [Anaerolineae bacterium]